MPPKGEIRLPITISAEQILVVIGAASAFTTAVWQAAMYVGKLSNRVDLIESRVDEHDHLFGRRASDRAKVEL
jgi:hypothetical protein